MGGTPQAGWQGVFARSRRRHPRRRTATLTPWRARTSAVALPNAAAPSHDRDLSMQLTGSRHENAFAAIEHGAPRVGFRPSRRFANLPHAVRHGRDLHRASSHLMASPTVSGASWCSWAPPTTGRATLEVREVRNHRPIRRVLSPFRSDVWWCLVGAAERLMLLSG